MDTGDLFARAFRKITGAGGGSTAVSKHRVRSSGEWPVHATKTHPALRRARNRRRNAQARASRRINRR